MQQFGTPKISQKLYEKIRDFLLRPELRLADKGRRKNLLVDAFKYWHPPILNIIDLEGAPQDFVIHLIEKMIDTGCVEGKHCLAKLFESFSIGESADTVAYINQLVNELNMEFPCKEKYVSESASLKNNLNSIKTLNEKYQLLDVICETPCSVYYKAIDLNSKTNRFVNFIQFNDIPQNNKNKVKSSIKSIAQLEHPHILPIYDWDQVNLDYVITKWADGESLQERLSKPISRKIVSDYISQICVALSYSHAFGVVHGDISPKNIFFDKKIDHIYLVGFTSTSQSALEYLQRPKRDKNSPDYYAPEHLERGEVTPETDQYMVALLSWRMLTGEYPFSDDADRGKYAKNGKSLPPNPTYVSDALYKVVNRACSGNPQNRFSSVVAFADAFKTAIDHNVSPTNLRDHEQSYLDLVVKDSTEAIRGYVSLKGMSISGAERTRSDILTGVAKAAVRHPIMYKINQPSEKTLEEVTEDIRDTITKSPKVVLLGEPGSGKTTTLIQLSLELSQEAQVNPDAPLPILVPLHSFNEQKGFKEFIREQMPQIGENLDEYLSKPGKMILLFDGLNETTLELRPQVVDFLKSLDRFVVSCRVKDYRQEFSSTKDITTITIMDLDPPRIRQAMSLILQPQLGDALWNELGGNDLVLRFWNKLVKNNDERTFWFFGEVPSYTHSDEDQAWQKMHEKALLPLCRNPFMLNMVCNLYEGKGELPDNRGALFRDFVNILTQREIERIAKVEGWEDLRDVQKTERQGFVYSVLILLASTIQEKYMGAGIEESLAIKLLNEKMPDTDVSLALNIARDSNLIHFESGTIVFTHQLIQEFFASEIMGRELDRDPSTPSAYFFNQSNWWETQGWEETAVILAGVRGLKELNKVVLWLASSQPEVSVRCILESGIPNIGIENMDRSVMDQIRTLWVNRLKTKEHPKARAAIGRALGTIGDPRKGTGITTQNSKTLPDIEWCVIDKLNISMSKYPITELQFKLFIEDTENGYSHNKWWNEEAKEWKRNGGQPYEGQLSLYNHPRCFVNWYEATAFCKWLSWKTDTSIRLPTEEEWLLVANNDANFEDVNIFFPGSDLSLNKVCAVGLYSHTPTRYGVEDLFGNVWEYCQDTFDSISKDVEISSQRISTRVLHGGSWKSTPDFVSIHYRYWVYPDYRSDEVGFRVVSEN